MSLFQPLLIVLLVALGVLMAAITVVGLVLARDTPHSNGLVRNWADGNGYRIIAAKRRYVFTGPFPQLYIRRGQVYRVEVEDRAGHIRRGWVQCGRGNWGTDPNKVSVRWDKV